jgi:hypothetical protein
MVHRGTDICVPTLHVVRLINMNFAHRAFADQIFGMGERGHGLIQMACGQLLQGNNCGMWFTYRCHLS